MIADVLGSQGFYNPGHQPNQQLDDLIARARQTYDQAERKKLYDQVQQLETDQVHDDYVLYATGQHAISRDGTIAFATVNFNERANALPKAPVATVIASAASARPSSSAGPPTMAPSSPKRRSPCNSTKSSKIKSR